MLSLIIASNNTSRKVIRHEIPLPIVSWLDHMLAYMTLVADKWDSTLRDSVNSGCPQRGVISPILWNLVTDNLLNKITKEGLQAVGYADHLMIVASSEWRDARIPKACKLCGAFQQSQGHGL